MLAVVVEPRLYRMLDTAYRQSGNRPGDDLMDAVLDLVEQTLEVDEVEQAKRLLGEMEANHTTDPTTKATSIESTFLG